MKIKFNKKKHTYYVGSDEYISVSTLIGRYFSKFDSKKIAKKLASFPINKANKRGVKYWIKLWKSNQEYGTKVHKDIENSILLSSKNEFIESENAKLWLDNYMKKLIKPFLMPELLLYSEEFKIAGTADLVIVHGEKAQYVTLIDWKCTKELKKKNYDNLITKFGFHDCNYYKYCLQLNMYAYLLRQNNHNVQDIKLVRVYGENIEVIDIPAMQDIIGTILEERKNEIRP